jgi:hypothetical protein
VLQPPLLLHPLGLPVPQLPHPIFQFKLKSVKIKARNFDHRLWIGIALLLNRFEPALREQFSDINMAELKCLYPDNVSEKYNVYNVKALYR